MKINLKNKSYSNSQSGFTLIELLIVIVIIGILAGVVIGVLNPVQQMNRARDGTVRAQLDKAALSAKSLFVSSPRSQRRSPTPLEFAGGLGNIAAGTTCTTNDDAATATCLYSVNNQPLVTGSGTSNAGCDGSFYKGSSTNQCQYVYWRDTKTFRIAAKGAATPARIFVYTFEELDTGNVSEGFYSCDPATYVIATDPAGVCTLL